MPIQEAKYEAIAQIVSAALQGRKWQIDFLDEHVHDLIIAVSGAIDESDAAQRQK